MNNSKKKERKSIHIVLEDQNWSLVENSELCEDCSDLSFSDYQGKKIMTENDIENYQTNNVLKRRSQDNGKEEDEQMLESNIVIPSSQYDAITEQLFQSYENQRNELNQSDPCLSIESLEKSEIGLEDGDDMMNQKSEENECSDSIPLLESSSAQSSVSEGPYLPCNEKPYPSIHTSVENQYSSSDSDSEGNKREKKETNCIFRRSKSKNDYLDVYPLMETLFHMVRPTIERHISLLTDTQYIYTRLPLYSFIDLFIKYLHVYIW